LSLSNGSLSPLASAAAPRSPVSTTASSTFVRLAPLSAPVVTDSRAAILAAQRAQREREENAERESAASAHSKPPAAAFASRSPAVAVAVATPVMTAPSRTSPLRGLEADETLLDSRRSKTASPVSRDLAKPAERRERQSALADMLASLDGSDASETSKSRATRPSSLAAMLDQTDGETSAPARGSQRRSNLADLLGDEASSPKASTSRSSNIFTDAFGSDDRKKRD